MRSIVTATPVALGEHCEAGAGVAVLGLADGAAVNEQDAAVLVHPGLVRVPEDEDVAVGERGDALEGARRLVLEQVLVHLPWRTVHEADAFAAELEAQVEGQLAHERLRAFVGVGERPVDRKLTDRSVVPVDVGAAAVFEVAPDRIVVVAVDGRDRAVFDPGADLVRVGAVADEVAAAVDGVDSSSAIRESADSSAGRLACMSVMTATRFSGRFLAIAVGQLGRAGRFAANELVGERAERRADQWRDR